MAMSCGSVDSVRGFTPFLMSFRHYIDLLIRELGRKKRPLRFHEIRFFGLTETMSRPDGKGLILALRASTLKWTRLETGR